MTTYTLNGKTILAVEVDPEANRFWTTGLQLFCERPDKFLGEHAMPLTDVIDLEDYYPGAIVLGRGRELDAAQCEMLVGKPPYCNFISGNILDKSYPGLWLQTPQESFASFLKANNISENDLLIVKKD